MSIQLMVGLANPGDEYAKTRHNAGAWFIENLARRFDFGLREEAKFEGLFAKVRGTFESIGELDARFLIPTTYMNHSGRSIAAVSSFFKIPSSEILVAHDELDLPVGVVRLKFGGGHGGHNGLRDIISAIGENFWRLRVGIGHPGHKDKVLDYVLHAPSKEERVLIDKGLSGVDAHLKELFLGQINRVMSTLNRGPL